MNIDYENFIEQNDNSNFSNTQMSQKNCKNTFKDISEELKDDENINNFITCDLDKNTSYKKPQRIRNTGKIMK
jgi:hypothetical protein